MGARDTAEGGRAVQQPYSEAYLSGQPNKRRKLITEKKPRGEVSNIISRSLQDAIEQTGLEPRTGEVVANVAAEWEQRLAFMKQPRCTQGRPCRIELAETETFR